MRTLCTHMLSSPQPFLLPPQRATWSKSNTEIRMDPPGTAYGQMPVLTTLPASAPWQVGRHHLSCHPLRPPPLRPPPPRRTPLPPARNRAQHHATFCRKAHRLLKVACEWRARLERMLQRAAEQPLLATDEHADNGLHYACKVRAAQLFAHKRTPAKGSRGSWGVMAACTLLMRAAGWLVSM